MQVVYADSFDCALELIKEGKRPVVLDFASGTNPGGAWRTSNQVGTQEESLCRRSNLGILLEKKKYPIPREGNFYIPLVTIQPQKRTCAVIASELKGISSSSSTYLQGRIENIYQTAIQHHHDSIVLGAWGCGAFSESEEDVHIMANLIQTSALLHQEEIETVCAILGKKNYKVFNQVATTAIR